MRRSLEELTAFAKETRWNGGSLLDRPAIRHRLADLWVDITVTRLLSYRVVSMQEQGIVPNHEASIVKVFNSELNQRIGRAGVDVLGLHGQLDTDSPHARLHGRFERLYMTSVGSTIAAGTSEIQRNIIATRGLGLPRY
jgi:alkylation response protein AidB-like acyl-CoA dehydrogenase